MIMNHKKPIIEKSLSTECTKKSKEKLRYREDHILIKEI